ncbi:unnamed protein product [Rotaria socialis]|uniref:Uncharacterized protein n=1 Tax=Rotaria socialis TaxID=392032 RepID=A0A817TJQ4_9BILA|nr:unnamed protein product [Rotaria socialis]CAF4451547.1 unnamed protein product [Rotaria socialis]
MTMNDDMIENQHQTESKLNNNTLDIICTLQECNPSESLIILQAFLHLINKQEYSNDFILYELNLLKRLSLSSSVSYIPSLFDLLQQFIPTSELILSFCTIRQSIVESFINQFRKDTQKQKWGGNGDKIQSLGCLLEQSLKLYASNEPLIKNSNHIWYAIVLNLFEPLIDELNEYLKSKLDKQRQQYLSLSHLVKSLARLCEQLSKIDEKKNCMIITEYFSDIILAGLHQRIDLILSKKMFDHFDSFDKLEQYKCPIRNSIFFVHPDIKKLIIFLDDAKISKNSSNLIKKCNKTFEQLLDKASQIFHCYPSSISLEHCICIISSLSSIEILFRYDQFHYFLYNFCQFMLSYWQINLLHDCDANNWLNTKAYLENKRYSVYIDTLFHHFNRLHLYLKRYCPNLLSIIIPYLLLELMNFIYQRYASIKISYARQSQYKNDLLAFLVHSSQYAHYFINNKSSIQECLLFNFDNAESKFIEHGNKILAAIVLVTCPCDILYEQLQNIVHRSAKLLPKLNWLAIIRPDWFDVDYQMRSQVQTFLTLANIVSTQQNSFPIDKLVTFVIENFELDTYGSGMAHLIMENERWDLIHLFAKYEHDWSFFNNQSGKLPRWLSTFMEYSEEYFTKCCSICASEKEIEWRLKIQQKIGSEQRYDEKLNYLKSLQHYITNIPFYLYHLLCAIIQYQPQLNKRLIFARLLYNYMIDHTINRANVYYSFLTSK